MEMPLVHVIVLPDRHRVVLEWCPLDGRPDELAAYRYVDVPIDLLQAADGLTDPMELCGMIPEGYEWRTADSDKQIFCFPKSEIPAHSEDLM